MKRRHSIADFLEGIKIIAQAMVLLALVAVGLYALHGTKCPFLLTVPLLAIYMICLSLSMLKVGFHIMLHGCYTEE